ncbi:conserved hypothetical protein [Uncinocarpus reesii 1704]|uniref:Nuclear speckle splicing regulatory protein 1 N-terminal domain-containing protein n=1 Tax=Uncinocarpus reesii (strain UAMH 1704) TaxID=336963 RepID=C4JEE6_UNCRE|nr:uncharacterized protein UREG_00785 [Uncinocarpus reesii 1704]EEP75938.1 conserved hypothetical protein [Uncinocarpus reesii 1704]
MAPPTLSGSSKPVDRKGEDYANLSALHSSTKHAREAASLDPSIYDYDAVYDSIHAKPTKSSTSAAAASEPKYITSLLRSAEVRKRDQLRARDKLLAREREAEGDEYADKEKFVTAAYKAQQEEVKQIEAEEAAKEKEEEERRKKGMGMMGFYKDMLARDGKKHEEAVKAAEEAVRNRAEKADDEDKKEPEDKSAAQIAAELNARGASIIVNDEGEVVDKRQLLSAGLNVASKPKQKATRARSTTESRVRDVRPDRFGAGSARSQQRARQTEMLAAQLEERMRIEKQEEEARVKELAEKNKSKKSESDVMSAKERYLARKREREKEKAAGT